MKAMRIALVSPYSWTYPGGVTRHIEALAERFIEDGHHVRVLAPFDPPDRVSAVLHRGARPQALEAARLSGLARPDDRLQGQRRGVEPVDHAVRRRDAAPRAAHRPLRRRPHPRAGRAADELGRDRLDAAAARRDVPLLLRQAAPERDREPARRAPGAQPPARPDRGLGGGRVDRPALVRRPLSGDPQRRPRRSRAGAPRPPPVRGERLRIVFVGQAVERKGLPLLLRAFEALREHIPTELTVIGPTPEELSPLMLDPRGVTRARQGRRRPQAARARAGRRAVRAVARRRELRDGADRGVRRRHAGRRVGHRRLSRRRPRRRRRRARAASATRRRSPRRCATSTRSPQRRAAMARAAARDVERFAWPRVAAEVMERLRGRDRDAGAGGRRRSAPPSRVGARAADLKPRVRGPAAAEPRAELPAVEAQPRVALGAAGRWSRGVARRRRAGVARAAEDRHLATSPRR